MKITEFRKLISEEIKKSLNETYRDAKDNVKILHAMLKKGGKEAKYVKDIFKDIKDELSIVMSLTDAKANLKLANKIPELDEYLDDAVENALDDGMGRMRGMMGGMQGMREDTINEMGPAEDNMGVAKSLVGKTVKAAKMGTMGSIVLIFDDGTKLQLSSKNIGRDKDPNLTIIQ